MQFPMTNISKDWDPQDDPTSYLLDDQFIRTSNQAFYREYILNHKFVDSSGDVYRVIDKKPADRWRQLLSFLPGIYKAEAVFSRTGERMDLEQVRQHMLAQISRLEDLDLKQEWLDKVKVAQTYSDVILS